MNTTLTIITFTAAVYGLVMGIIMAFSIRPQLLHQEKLYISHNKITGFTQLYALAMMVSFATVTLFNNIFSFIGPICIVGFILVMNIVLIKTIQRKRQWLRKNPNYATLTFKVGGSFLVPNIPMIVSVDEDEYALDTVCWIGKKCLITAGTHRIKFKLEKRLPKRYNNRVQLLKQYIEADFQPGNIYCVEEDIPDEHLTLHSIYKEVVDQKQKV